MISLPERVDEGLRAHGLLRRGQPILVAVSGGLDSVVLLQVLHELSRKYSWKLTVAHLNHKLRGRSSDADERLVVRVARKLGLRSVVHRVDVQAFARSHKLSLEMAARKVRHDFLARTASRLKISTIALAHHADDQVELFFLRLFRGSGGEGLAGMKPRSPSPADPAIILIRPLLEEPKASLRDFAAAGKLKFREDASNDSLDIQRNRIRHELLPLLRAKYQPAIDRVVSRAMDIAGVEAGFVSGLAAEWLAARRPEVFEKLPMAVQRRCIQIQLQQHGIASNFELVERLRTTPEDPVTVAPGKVALLERGKLAIRSTTQVARNQEHQRQRGFRVTEDRDGTVWGIVFEKVQIEWSVARRRSSAIPKSRPGRELFDADRVGPQIVLRHWKPGDRFQPIGMPRPIKLQDLFTNGKIPRARRHELLVAETETGEIFWVENLRISEQFKVTGHTIRCLLWNWKHL